MAILYKLGLNSFVIARKNQGILLELQLFSSSSLVLLQNKQFFNCAAKELSFCWEPLDISEFC